jgi:hypothetical protein
MRGKSKTLAVKMTEIERAAGVDLFGGGGANLDLSKYKADQENLALANPEYKAVRDEFIALRNKQYAKRDAKQKRAREMWSNLLPVLELTSLTDAQKSALRVARELLWQCKPGAIDRAEKTIKRELRLEAGKRGVNAF